jgi:DNA-binding transcriptional regulator YhcF (GntR family)
MIPEMWSYTMEFPELNNNKSYSTTKLRHLVHVLSNAISQGRYKAGQTLPSVNQISRQYNLSRDTVFKAYQELKSQGIIDSTPAKSYHVVQVVNKVMLMLDVYSPFKDALYNAFVSNLPKNYKVDLVFHFYNEHLFETVIHDSLGRYNHYVIMNFNDKILHESLRKIDPGKLLLLDLGDFDKGDYPFICQDFGKSVYACMMENAARFKKYRSLLLYLPDESEHPRILIRYFNKFVRDAGLTAAVIKTLPEDEIPRNTAFLVIQQKDLVHIVKRCRLENLKIGTDVGLVAYNDTPMYEIIENGITVISTDFTLMGHLASDYVKTRQKVDEVIPARMIVRGSL